VVNEESRADLGPGMDLDSGEKPGEVREETGEEIETVPPEPMGEAVKRNGMEAGIAEEHLEDRSRSWISIEGGLDIRPQAAKQAVLPMKVPRRILRGLALRPFFIALWRR